MSSWSFASDSSADASVPSTLGLNAAHLHLGRPSATEKDAARQAKETRWFQDEIQQFEPRLRSWLRMTFPRLKDINDIVQESYLRLFKARNSGIVMNSSRRYLYGIARFVALEACRRQQVFPPADLHELPECDGLPSNFDTVGAVERNQEVELVVEALKRLPRQRAEVALLYTQMGLSYKEIAARLKLDESTVRKHMQLAVRECAAYFHNLDRKQHQP